MLRDCLTACTITSPLGPMVAVTDSAGGLVRLDFADPAQIDGGGTRPPSWRALPVAWGPPGCFELERQVRQYFEGSRTCFDIPLSFRLGSAFSQRVWQELLAIPFGETTTYGVLAAKLGRPGASRAIGRANAANPISLLVPCHRVIAADGSLAGYSSGTHFKRALLAHEHAHVTGRSTLPTKMVRDGTHAFSAGRETLSAGLSR